MIWFRKQVQLAEAAAADAVRSKIEAEESLEVTRGELELERAKRISAEVVASERKEELLRMIEENRGLREQLAERLKSLDALNLKLMEPRAVEPTPDLEKFKQAAAPVETARQVITAVRDWHRQADMAILTKLHPKFQNLTQNSVHTNVPQETAMEAAD